MNGLGLTDLACSICGDIFRGIKGGKPQKYYCFECRKRTILSNCEHCGKEFVVKHHRGLPIRHCSPLCNHQAKYGRWKIRNVTGVEKSRTYYRMRGRARIANGLCGGCGKAPPKEGSKCLCEKCFDSRVESRFRSYKRLREEIFAAYGGKCACPPCGEAIPEFLTIDHIFNDGKAHREEVGVGEAMYRWLKKHGFPKDRYQLLCFMCNWAKSKYGVCPHNREEFALREKRLHGRWGMPTKEPIAAQTGTPIQSNNLPTIVPGTSS